MRTYIFLVVSTVACIYISGCSKKDTASDDNTTTTQKASKVQVETYAGKDIVNSISGPGSLCLDQNGYLYIAETDHNVVIKIDPLLKTIGKFAGLFNTPGCLDDPFGTGVPSLTFPENLWIGSDQQIYIGDYGCGKAKIANTTGELASLRYNNPLNLGPSINATCKDFKGNIYILDTYDGLYEVRYQDQVLTSLIGGDKLGIASSITTDASEKNIFIAAKHQILEYSNGSLLSIAGDSLGHKDGQGASASFGGAMAICVGSNGIIYVADTNNNLIREVTPAGLVTTLAGDGNSGFVDGSGDKAEFASPRGIAFTTSGDNNILFVSDYGNNVIRKLTFPQK